MLCAGCGAGGPWRGVRCVWPLLAGRVSGRLCGGALRSAVALLDCIGQAVWRDTGLLMGFVVLCAVAGSRVGAAAPVGRRSEAVVARMSRSN